MPHQTPISLTQQHFLLIIGRSGGSTKTTQTPVYPRSNCLPGQEPLKRHYPSPNERPEYHSLPGMTILADHEVLLVPEQFATIQLAVDAVSGPSTIVVAPGVYSECVRIIGKRSIVIQSARLSRRGVTISGDGTEAAVLFVERSGLYLSGLEVRSNVQLRGILVIQSSISLQDCIIAGNRTGDGPVGAFGAGIFARDSQVHIQKSAVVGNTVDCQAAAIAGGAGLYLNDCRSEIAGSTIQGNSVYAGGELRGGGIWAERSSMRMWRSRVTDNALYGESCKGGGVYFKDALTSRVGGSVITGNGCQNGRGGGTFADGDSTQINIHRNTVIRQNYPTDLEFA